MSNVIFHCEGIESNTFCLAYLSVTSPDSGMQGTQDSEFLSCSYHALNANLEQHRHLSKELIAEIARLRAHVWEREQGMPRLKQ